MPLFPYTTKDKYSKRRFYTSILKQLIERAENGDIKIWVGTYNIYSAAMCPHNMICHYFSKYENLIRVYFARYLHQHNVLYYFKKYYDYQITKLGL